MRPSVNSANHKLTDSKSVAERNNIEPEDAALSCGCCKSAAESAFLFLHQKFAASASLRQTSVCHAYDVFPADVGTCLAGTSSRVTLIHICCLSAFLHNFNPVELYVVVY